MFPLVNRPQGYNLNAYGLILPKTFAQGNSFGNTNLLKNGDAGSQNTRHWQTFAGLFLTVAKRVEAVHADFKNVNSVFHLAAGTGAMGPNGLQVMFVFAYCCKNL